MHWRNIDKRRSKLRFCRAQEDQYSTLDRPVESASCGSWRLMESVIGLDMVFSTNTLGGPFTLIVHLLPCAIGHFGGDQGLGAGFQFTLQLQIDRQQPEVHPELFICSNYDLFGTLSTRATCKDPAVAYVAPFQRAFQAAKDRGLHCEVVERSVGVWVND
jgi:hypothetical protein